MPLQAPALHETRDSSDISKVSAPTPFALKWVGSKQQRAERIPEVEWANRKSRLRELYSKLTLPEIMKVMESEKFKPR